MGTEEEKSLTLAQLLEQFGTYLDIPQKLLTEAGYVRRETLRNNKKGYDISPIGKPPKSKEDEHKEPNSWGKYRTRKK